MYQFILSFLVLGASTSFASDCTRKYSTETKLHQIRLVSDSGRGHWEIGTETPAHQWTSLPCQPELDTEFFNGSNSVSQDEHGVGHVGQSASTIYYPVENIPGNIEFVANPQQLFGENRIDVPLRGIGRVFLNRSVYQRSNEMISGIHVEIFSDATNPQKSIAEETLQLMTSLFPHRTEQMRWQDKLTVVLLRNTTEHFQEKTLRSNGMHHPKYLWSILFSEDGTNTRRHSYHEIGGLFRISNDTYAHGLTWMVAYDQMDKRAQTGAEVQQVKCDRLAGLIDDIQSTGPGVKDRQHPIEYYLADLEARNGYPMYAWGSGIIWEKINAELDLQGLPNMYQLLDSIHAHVKDPVTDKNDLDQLMSAYHRWINPEKSPVFSSLAKQYFREKSLEQLLNETQSEQKQLGCKSGTH